MFSGCAVVVDFDNATNKPWGKAVTVVLVAALFVFFTCGVHYGWPSLLLVFKDEGVYSELCLDLDPENVTTGLCPEQDIKFNLIYTVALIAAILASGPAGFILDKYGERVTLVVGAVVLTSGCILLGASSKGWFTNCFA
jgi:MFS family permease